MSKHVKANFVHHEVCSDEGLSMRDPSSESESDSDLDGLIKR